jgi:hypothetical protein
MLVCSWFPYMAGSSEMLGHGMDNFVARGSANLAISLGTGIITSFLVSLHRNNGVSKSQQPPCVFTFVCLLCLMH